MKQANEDAVKLIEVLANQFGYDLVPSKASKPLITWTLLTETEQAQFEAKSLDELNKELKIAQDKLAYANTEIESKKSDFLTFLNKNKANKAVETVASGYGYTLPAFIVEVESGEIPKLRQIVEFIKDVIFKKSLEELGETYGKKVEYTQRSNLSKFVMKL